MTVDQNGAMHPNKAVQYNCIAQVSPDSPSFSGVSSMELRELEHPPQLWHNSKISISVTTIVTHNRKLVATTNNRLTGV